MRPALCQEGVVIHDFTDQALSNDLFRFNKFYGRKACLENDLVLVLPFD